MDWKAAAIVVTVVAVIGTILGISFAGASGGGAARYELTVRFSTAVGQDDIDEVAALLRALDDDVELVIMEMFPPVGRAELATDGPDFCRTIQAQLEAESYVEGVSCRPSRERAQTDPAAPASMDDDVDSN